MDFFSQFQIGDKVEFRPMYRQQQQLGIADEFNEGEIVAVRFTKAKVFYDILDDYHAKVFENVDSIKVKEAHVYNIPVDEKVQL